MKGHSLAVAKSKFPTPLQLFVAVNLVGLFVHNLMEVSQRKAFLDTRNCIAARLEMEDENEKLVRNNEFPLFF